MDGGPCRETDQMATSGAIFVYISDCRRARGKETPVRRNAPGPGTPVSVSAGEVCETNWGSVDRVVVYSIRFRTEMPVARASPF